MAITSWHPFRLSLLLATIPSSLALPAAPSTAINQPCGTGSQPLNDCPSSLTCIPNHANCTIYWIGRPFISQPCPGTCQHLDPATEQIYTLCGNMIYMSDCIEGNERCVRDPRRWPSSGTPEADGQGICWPFRDMCGWDTGLTCAQGKVCFGGEKSAYPGLKEGPFCVEGVILNGTKQRRCGGACFPLRYGSDYYEKSRAVEVWRHEQGGYQGKRPPVWEEPDFVAGSGN